MVEELKPMDEIREYVKKQEQSTATEKADEEIKTEILESQALVETHEKSIVDLSVADIKMNLDKNKSMEQQAEDIVSAMATAKAVQDEQTAKELTEKKSKELLAKAEAKEKKAKADSIKAETEKQKEQRKLYEAVLEHFAIKKHLPFWLMVIATIIFSPLYILMAVIIGAPFGFVKTVMDNLDNVVCRYEEIDQKAKPKVRISIWILLAILLVSAICLTILKATKVI